jgi:putative component of membrane protein insertase Oxa1/YidC/SpoIIIJ protein YidD
LSGIKFEPVSFEGNSLEECDAKMREHFKNLPLPVAMTRELVRPKITLLLILGFIIPMLVLAGGLTATNILLNGWLKIALNAVLPVLYVLTCSKYNAIFFVRLYQRFAPAKIRLYCAMQPCCSDYMILAIKKFGLIRGLIKGRCRFLRCGNTNITIDYP